MHVTSVADSLLNEIMHTRKKEGRTWVSRSQACRQASTAGFQLHLLPYFRVHLHSNLVTSRLALFIGGSNDNSND